MSVTKVHPRWPHPHSYCQCVLWWAGASLTALFLRCVSICSLAFSMDGMFLSASSNTETVHIFKLEAVREKPPEEPTTWTGYFGKVLMASTSYLPSQVTEMFNQGRAFATVRLPFCGHKTSAH